MAIVQNMIPPELAAVFAETEEPRKLTAKEKQWFSFVNKLEPWQFHKLMIVGEMELHDRFVAGENLDKIFEEICASGEDNPYRKSKEDASPVPAK